MPAEKYCYRLQKRQILSSGSTYVTSLLQQRLATAVTQGSSGEASASSASNRTGTPEKRRPSLERLASYAKAAGQSTRQESTGSTSKAAGSTAFELAKAKALAENVPGAPTEPPPELAGVFEFPESTYTYGGQESGDVELSIRQERQRDIKYYASRQAAAIQDPSRYILGEML